MPILQFQCNDCSALFDHLFNASYSDVSCVSCESKSVLRTNHTQFYANKNFCPHDKDLSTQTDHLKDMLGKIVEDRSASCGGCGVDGPKGSCGSGGGCGNCSGGCSSKKITTAAGAFA